MSVNSARSYAPGAGPTPDVGSVIMAVKTRPCAAAMGIVVMAGEAKGSGMWIAPTRYSDPVDGFSEKIRAGRPMLFMTVGTTEDEINVIGCMVRVFQAAPVGTAWL